MSNPIKFFFILFIVMSYFVGLLNYSVNYNNTHCLAPDFKMNAAEFFSRAVTKIMNEPTQLDFRLEKVKYLFMNHPQFINSKIDRDFHANSFFIWFIDHKRKEVWSFDLLEDKEEQKISPKQIKIGTALEQIKVMINDIKGISKEKIDKDKVLHTLEKWKIVASYRIEDKKLKEDLLQLIEQTKVIVRATDMEKLKEADADKALFEFISVIAIKKLRTYRQFLEKQFEQETQIEREKRLKQKEVMIYLGSKKSMKNVSKVMTLLFSIPWENFDDLVRNSIQKKIDKLNSTSRERLVVFLGRITPQEKVIGNKLFVRFDIDDFSMGSIILNDGRVKYLPRKVFMEQEIKAKIEQLSRNYSHLFKNGEKQLLKNMFDFLKVSGKIIKKHRRSIENMFVNNKYEHSSKDNMEGLSNWFYEFVRSRDHGFIHALIDLEWVLKQIDYAVNPENNYLFEGKRIVLQDTKKSFSSDMIVLDMENLIYATMLHDVTSIVKRSMHHESGVSVARIILRELDFSNEQIAKITNIMLRHRGKRFVVARTLEDNLLEKGDSAAASEIDRLYYKESDMKLPSIMTEKISFLYRLGVLSGILEHESFTKDQSTDPLMFYMYSILFRCFKLAASEYTYEGFAPIESMLPDLLEKEFASLKRQIRFDNRYDKETKNKYIQLVDYLYLYSKKMIEDSTIVLMNKYKDLFPLFKLPPYTNIEEVIKAENDWLNYLIPSKARKFHALPLAERQKLLKDIRVIFEKAKPLAKNLQMILETKDMSLLMEPIKDSVLKYTNVFAAAA